MTDHVIGIRKRAAQGQHNASTERFGDAAGSFAELAAYRIGLLEVGMRTVEYERLAAPQSMLEDALEARVPSFGHTRGDANPFTFLGVVVDIEVLGLQDLKIEFPVLNLVAAEVLGRRGRGRHHRARGGER